MIKPHVKPAGLGSGSNLQAGNTVDGTSAQRFDHRFFIANEFLISSGYGMDTPRRFTEIEELLRRVINLFALVGLACFAGYVQMYHQTVV